MAKRFRIAWTEVAANDYEAIVTYVAARSGRTRANKLAERIEKRIATLVSTPKRGRVVPELRALGVDRYREEIMKPYRIIYRATKTQVIVLAIVDGRRDLQELLVERVVNDP